MRPPPHSYRPVSDLSRVVKIPVLRCTASQDIKAKPTRSLSDKGAFHQSVEVRRMNHHRAVAIGFGRSERPAELDAGQ